MSVCWRGGALFHNQQRISWRLTSSPLCHISPGHVIRPTSYQHPWDAEMGTQPAGYWSAPLLPVSTTRVVFCPLRPRHKPNVIPLRVKFKCCSTRGPALGFIGVTGWFASSFHLLKLSAHCRSNRITVYIPFNVTSGVSWRCVLAVPPLWLARVVLY